MIFVTDKGRMANNIFLYGQLYAWGREHGRKTLSLRFSYKYRDFRISQTQHHNFLTYLLIKIATKLKLLPVVKFNTLNEDWTQQQNTMLTEKNVVATGWCVRFPDLFEKYKQEIVSLFDFLPAVHQQVSRSMQQSEAGTVKLGVHIRRGDYFKWCGGRYFFDDQQYISIISEFVALQQGRKVDVYVCSNDPQLNRQLYADRLSPSRVFFPYGSPAEDLCLLSECDYIIGAPSTFTLVASMYHDAPLYWISDTHHRLSLDDFHGFDFQARHFDEYYIDDSIYQLRKATADRPQPLVSLIVAAYNTADYMRECIDSVVAQTYRNWELIIVDDGSTDGTSAICDEYAARDERISVVHKENSGKPDCCNMAIGMARGEFVGFLDSDDWIEPAFCQTLLDAIDQTGKDCATCGYMNEFVGETVFDPASDKLQTLSPSKALTMIYGRRLYGYLHGRLYRRELLVEPVPQLRRYEDFAVIYKWLSHGNGVALCPNYLYHYRQRQSSIMNSDDDHMYGFIPLLEACYHYVRDNSLLTEEQNKSLVVRNCIRIAKDIARRTRGSETDEQLKSIRRVIRRMQPVSESIVGSKSYRRMHLLLFSITLFKHVMRIRHLYFKGRQGTKLEYFK